MTVEGAQLPMYERGESPPMIVFNGLGAIRAPTLIIHGRADPLVPFANREKLRDLIPGARLVALDDCGHIVSWEKPDEAAAAIVEFVRS